MTLREHELTVQRSACYYTLGGGGRALRDIWMVCHGYGQLAARFARHFAAIATPERLIVVPEALSRFYIDAAAREVVGASWMTREHRQAEIADYVAYLDAVAAVVDDGRGARVTAFGFSQGASTASRWVAMGHHPASRLILWGGELPPDLDLRTAAPRFATLDVVVVRGKDDEVITAKVVTGIVSRLREHKVRHRFVEFEGGHEVDVEVLASIASE